MWENEMTGEVFETQQEAIDDILENLDLYDGDDLYDAITDLDCVWIFENLTPEAKEIVREKWIDKVIEYNLTAL